MNKSKSILMAGALALVFCAVTITAKGQGGGGPGGGGFGAGGFDMSQMMRMLVDGMREPMEVTDDTEWKVIADQIQKVNEARMKASTGGMGMFGMMGRRGGMGGGGAGAGGGGGGGGGRGMGQLAALFSNPEGEALQKVIDAKASNAELKAAVARFVEARKQKQAELEKAQADLKKLLSVRQEAIAYSLGLL